MEAKQVNITVPIKLYHKIEEHVDEHGYRNAQDFFLDLARKKVIFENSDTSELREEFVNGMLSLKKDDFLGVKESNKVHKKLMKRAGL